MISDVLSDARASMQEYLDHPGTRDSYTGDVRTRILALMGEMDDMRAELDAPPGMGDAARRMNQAAREGVEGSAGG